MDEIVKEAQENRNLVADAIQIASGPKPNLVLMIKNVVYYTINFLKIKIVIGIVKIIIVN